MSMDHHIAKYRKSPHNEAGRARIPKLFELSPKTRKFEFLLV